MLFSALFLLRAGFFGFSYYPMLDDFIQYRVYSFYENPFKDVILRIGLLSSRPLAGFTDVFVISRFWNNLSAAYFLLTLAYITSCLIFHRILSKYLRCGYSFLIFFALAPFLLEGIYWISASSRLVIGLFFAALSALSLDLYFVRKKIHFLLPFAVLNLLSYGLYEQIAILSFLVSVLIIFLNRPKKITSIYLIPLINCAVIGFFYLFVRTGASLSSSRIRLAPFFSGYSAHISGVFFGFCDAVKACVKITLNGFMSGLNLYFDGYGYLLLLLSVILLIFLFHLLKVKLPTPRAICAIVGIIIFILALLPYLLLSGSPITLRGMLVPIFGLALAADYLIRIAFKKKKWLHAAALTIVAFVFLTAGIGETWAYTNSAREDMASLNALNEYLSDKNIKNDEKIALVGAPEYYSDAVPFYEHIYSTFSSQWALSGALRALSNDSIKYAVYPIRQEAYLHSGYDDFEGYSRYFAASGQNYFKLTAEIKEDIIAFYGEDGELFCEIKKRSDGYYAGKIQKIR